MRNHSDTNQRRATQTPSEEQRGQQERLTRTPSELQLGDLAKDNSDAKRRRGWTPSEGGRRIHITREGQLRQQAQENSGLGHQATKNSKPSKEQYGNQAKNNSITKRRTTRTPGERQLGHQATDDSETERRTTPTPSEGQLVLQAKHNSDIKRRTTWTPSER